MKITEVKCYPVWVGHRNQCLVKIETDEGLYGWGESGLSGRELAVAGAVKHYREFLIGRDPMQIGALWQEMYRSQYFEGGRVLTAAISAIDLALYDIAGKALGVPVYQLLGGKHRDFVPCFATMFAPNLEGLIEGAQLLLREGWNVIRTVPNYTSSADYGAGGSEEAKNIWEPWASIGVTARNLTKLREAIGSDAVLGIDYHHRLSVAEAASFCQRMPAGTLDFLEEPIRDESPEAYEALRKLTSVPFAIGEEISSKWHFLPYIERGITNYVRLDVCNVGGLTESMKVAAMAEAHYIDLMPHNPLGPICTAATIHLAAAVPNFAWLEVRVSPTEPGRFSDPDIFPVQPTLTGAHFPILDTPGLGVEVNEELILKQEFKFWEAPHLRRRDGSYTNW
ncbi:MAG: mandelate racemase/muconate lactonizing enzyme family protein [Caldilineaceae bacterium]|nr:mandelate racemase/muconate lactonizing enzyme family protein [Caldilineaceae bacterium]